MYQVKHIFLLTFLISLFSISFASAEESWKLEKDKDGIKVWTRKVENSQLKEFKVSAILNTTADKLISFFKNVSRYDEWMYKVDKNSPKIIKKNNDNDYYTYLTISVPLIKTRDAITHMVFNAPDSKGEVLINLDGAPNLIAKNENYIRIPLMKAYFKIDPIGNGKIQLTHQAFSKVGGSIPDFFVNMGSVDAPFYMFTKLRELVQ